MRTSNVFTSPNFAAENIPVHFVVLHYTAADLERTFEIFGDPDRGTCAHFVLDVDGTVYDLGGFLSGPIRRGAHAGESLVELDGRRYVALNQMSIGIEIINLNGNVFAYTDAQYAALNELLKTLIARFPEVGQPGHVLGHEHIAGFRGKCDPGVEFDWPRALTGTGAPPHPLHDTHACVGEDLTFVRALAAKTPNPDPEFWSNLSTELETRIKHRRSTPY